MFCCIMWELHTADQEKAMRESLKTAWQGHPFQALWEPLAKCQALQIAWQGHLI